MMALGLYRRVILCHNRPDFLQSLYDILLLLGHVSNHLARSPAMTLPLYQV